MLAATGGSFVVPLMTAGGVCILGAAVYMFLIEDIAPLEA